MRRSSRPPRRLILITSGHIGKSKIPAGFGMSFMSSEIDLATIAAARRRYFTPRWFGDLLAARLSLGDTFWIGTYGTALIFIPIGFVLLVLTMIFLPPEQVANMLSIWLAFIAVFYVVLLTAVFRTALRTPQVGAWRWVGVFIALVNAAAAVFYAYIF